MGMSYFSGPTSPDDFEDGYSADSSRRPRGKLAIALLLIVAAGLSSTFAANISLNGGQRKEFGQGIYQIKACDQWVGVGLTAGTGTQNDYVKNVKLYGFDPQLCLGRVFRIKLFPAGSTTALPLYVDETATGLSTGDTTTVLSLVDTSTAYSSNYPTYPSMNAYDSWSADAVTLLNALGTNIKYNSKWLNISYTKDTGVYTIILKYPAAIVAQVGSVTIESAKYN